MKLIFSGEVVESSDINMLCVKTKSLFLSPEYYYIKMYTKDKEIDYGKSFDKDLMLNNLTRCSKDLEKKRIKGFSLVGPYLLNVANLAKCQVLPNKFGNSCLKIEFKDKTSYQIFFSKNEEMLEKLCKLICARINTKTTILE